jgi:hypothetical protein
MRLSTVLARIHARSLACGLLTAGLLVVPGCKSAPHSQAAEQRSAVLMIENLGNCAWRIQAVAAGKPTRSITVPVGGTVRLELSAGTYEMTQEALAGLDAGEAVRHFVMPLAANETYHWRLVTLATVPGDLRR